MKTPVSGVNSTATTQDAINAIPTTANNVKVYSPALLAAKPTGTNPAMVTNVPVNIGKAVDLYANVAAVILLLPSSSFLIIISTAIIASSTSSPNPMISAPREMRCRLTPASFIVANVIARTSGMAMATTMPGRQPSDRKLTPRTMTMASIKVLMNSPTASSTTSGWLATR